MCDRCSRGSPKPEVVASGHCVNSIFGALVQPGGQTAASFRGFGTVSVVSVAIENAREQKKKKGPDTSPILLQILQGGWVPLFKTTTTCSSSFSQKHSFDTWRCRWAPFRGPRHSRRDRGSPAAPGPLGGPRGRREGPPVPPGAPAAVAAVAPPPPPLMPPVARYPRLV